MEPELYTPPDGPTDEQTALPTRLPLEKTVDFLAEFLLSSSRVPEGTVLTKHAEKLEDLQQEVWFCHWGIVVTLSVYQQLISHVDIAVREAVAWTLGAALAESEGVMTGERELTDLIEAEMARHGVANLKPDLRLIAEELRCTALHSTVVCYIRDITLHIHSARLLDKNCTLQELFPMDKQCVGRHFFSRLMVVSAALLDILYMAAPLAAPLMGPVA